MRSSANDGQSVFTFCVLRKEFILIFIKSNTFSGLCVDVDRCFPVVWRSWQYLVALSPVCWEDLGSFFLLFILTALKNVVYIQEMMDFVSELAFFSEKASILQSSP